METSSRPKNARRLSALISGGSVATVVLLFSFAASAELVRHTFGGVIDVADPVIGFDNLLGKDFEILIEYELTTPGRVALEPDPTNPVIAGGIIEYSAGVMPVDESDPLGDFVYSSRPITHQVRVDGELLTSNSANQGPIPRNDLRRLQPVMVAVNDSANPAFPVPMTPPAQYDTVSFFAQDFALYLSENSASLLDDGRIPLDLSHVAFSQALFNRVVLGPTLPGQAPIAYIAYGGQIASITSTIVPEPGTALLVGIGLIALARWR